MITRKLFSSFILALAVVAAASSPAMAGGLALKIEDATGPAGGTVVLPVTVSGAEKLGALDLEIQYDLAFLSFKEASLGELSTNGLVESNSGEKLRVSFVDSRGLTGDGTVLKLTFGVNGNKGQTSKVDLASAKAFGVDLKDTPIAVFGGTVTVGSGRSLVFLIGIVAAFVVGAVLVVIFRPRAKKSAE